MINISLKQISKPIWYVYIYHSFGYTYLPRYVFRSRPEGLRDSFFMRVCNANRNNRSTEGGRLGVVKCNWPGGKRPVS